MQDYTLGMGVRENGGRMEYLAKCAFGSTLQGWITPVSEGYQNLVFFVVNIHQMWTELEAMPYSLL